MGKTNFLLAAYVTDSLRNLHHKESPSKRSALKKIAVQNVARTQFVTFS